VINLKNILLENLNGDVVIKSVENGKKLYVSKIIYNKKYNGAIRFEKSNHPFSDNKILKMNINDAKKEILKNGILNNSHLRKIFLIDKNGNQLSLDDIK